MRSPLPYLYLAQYGWNGIPLTIGILDHQVAYIGCTQDVHQVTQDVDRLFPHVTTISEELDEHTIVLASLDRGICPVPFAPLGTSFQQMVWQQLGEIPGGAVWTYQELANKIQKPRAVRAVANAVGANPWAILVPCHRVVRTDGGLGGYHYGTEIKAALLAMEKK